MIESEVRNNRTEARRPDRAAMVTVCALCVGSLEIRQSQKLEDDPVHEDQVSLRFEIDLSD